MSLKIPFETDDTHIREIETILADFCLYTSAPTLHISGFGRFGSRTAYLDVMHTHDALAFVHACIGTLTTHASWLTRPMLRGHKLHASVARFMGRRQSQRVWSYLHKRKPRFKTTLDNVTILKRGARGWEVHRTFSLEPQRNKSIRNTPFLIPTVQKVIGV